MEKIKKTSKHIINIIKQPRNDIVDYFFCKKDLNCYDFESWRQKDLVVTIAYNTPWTIEYLTRLWSMFFPDVALAIFDNSSDLDKAAEIRSICKNREFMYVKLPVNPEWHPCRSHGIAINWVFYNFIKRAELRSFFVLDHDMFPIRRSNFLAPLDIQPFYGFERHLRRGWYLWAGYGGFNYNHIREHRLNFNHDQVRGLDTGGRNFSQYFQHQPRFYYQSANVHLVEVENISDNAKMDLVFFDDCFMHFGGASYKNNIGLERDFMQQYLDSVLSRTADEQFIVKIKSNISGIKND